MQIQIYLDSDESQMFQVQNIKKVESIDDLISMCLRQFQMNTGGSVNYGFKTKQQ